VTGLTRAWFCLWADHNGHSGCSNMLWLSDAYDYITGFVSLAAVATVLAMMAHDKWRHDRGEFWANVLDLAVMAVIGCAGGAVLVALRIN
jgi:hypothetical protein